MREVLKKWVRVSRIGAQFPHVALHRLCVGWVCHLQTPPEAIQICSRALPGNSGKRHLKGNVDMFPSYRVVLLLCPPRDPSRSKGKRLEGLQPVCSHEHQLPKQQAGLAAHSPMMRVMRTHVTSAWCHVSLRPRPCSFKPSQVSRFSSLLLFTQHFPVMQPPASVLLIGCRSLVVCLQD